MSPQRTQFDVSIDFYETWGLVEFWPDGDAPDNPTVDDAIARIKESGSVLDWMRDWNVDRGLTVSVNGKTVW